jgi:hypothetical protein
MSDEPTPDERDEPLKIDLDPEAALKGLLEVDPHAEWADAKQRKLDWLSKAPTHELTDAKIRDGLIAEAREAGATQDEIEDALSRTG